MGQVVPRYGSGSLADVVPSAAAALGVAGYTNLLGFRPTRRVCLLLVDGLGHRLLDRYAAQAPFLSELTATHITAGFPSTTATSISSIGTGLPPGEHGIVGLSFAVCGDGVPKGTVLNALGWNSSGPGRPHDLRATVVPEEQQPAPTLFDAMAADGVAVTTVTPKDHVGSGLSRAVLRGADPVAAAALGDVVGRAVAATSTGPGERAFCYAYHGDLDMLGHVYGPGSLPWMMQLRQVDTLAESLAAALPSDCLLVITADHGMIEAPEASRIDFDAESDLRAGVRLLAGEPRVRHVHTTDGALDDVRAAWSETLGQRAWILTRDEAAAAGWFGPRVLDRTRERIGDLVVAMRGAHTVVRPSTEPVVSHLIGQHGSLTEDEQLVPVLVR
ncbi:alkaline phosphatase family protein [Tsukamurella strandjordii]|uniref:alkaline phosphatase family protein n=1 Tax=Tsukamurella TaxID=2060 RepID=UPI001C7CE1DA|nr:alkaline phosphatase family protein [Tsukamurella sp. TY48]GIZ98812.1 phosphodiesterase [Tsukamurella sp. TY48]